uniref:Leukotriene C4 synthase n=1 Tax=Terrapene triunguis TaxID=2587831 RepID=A0A674KG04_9SAUR
MSYTKVLKAHGASVFFFFQKKLSPFAPLHQCNIVFVQRCIEGSTDKNVKSDQIQLASLWELPLRKKLESYFALQVIYARRKYKVSPPDTAGPPEFERVFRAQANCSEYFPIFVSVLWVAGIFFQQGVAAVCGLLYLYARYQYFQGYTLSAHGRLGPMYFSAKVLWILIGLSVAGLLVHFLSLNSFVGRMEIPSKLQLLFRW